MSLISRVDLLSLINQSPAGLIPELADVLGYEFRDDMTADTVRIHVEPGAESHLGLLQSQTTTEPDFQPAFWYVQQYHSREQEQDDNQQPIVGENTERQLQPRPERNRLFNSAQQQVLWDRCLQSRARSGDIDLCKTIKQLSQCKPLVKLPRKQRNTHSQETILFLDRSVHLSPIWQDQLDLAHALRQLIGQEQCQIVLMLNGMIGKMRRWGQPRTANWTLDQLPDAAQLLFISDLGVYNPHSGAQQDWQTHLTRLERLGHPLAVLTPLTQAEVSGAIRQYSLDQSSSQFSKLQVLMSQCLQPPLERIRHLRQQVAGGCLEDELRLWNHPQRSPLPTGMSWRLDFDYLQQWFEAASLGKHEKQVFQELQSQWRASMAPETEGYERLLDQALDPAAKSANPGLFDALLTSHQEHPHGQTMAQRCLQSQQSLLTAQPMVRTFAGVQKWRPLYQATQQVCRQTKQQNMAFNPDNPVLYLQQIGVELHCKAATQRSVLSATDYLIDLDRGEELSIGRRLQNEPLHLRSAQADVNLATITKPDWAERFWLDDNGVYAAHEDQALFYLQPASGEQLEANWVCLHNPWSWASDCGIDEYGLWADLSVEHVVYRLRWIVPGTFLMGSPGSEVDREDDETQHRVTLTHGFWLGETSCTQAFWQAVMGENPGYFKDDPQLPVEQVSWKHCQQFLSSLQAKHTYFTASLPSEAQWEYACRAGTQTVFSWGDHLNTEQANYNGNAPYADGKKGEYRRRSIPVKAFQPNPWGLYQNHGNVWEWCQDWYGDYQNNDTVDPQGPKQGRARVLRGGSWINLGSYLRVARRSASEQDYRSSHIGFRLVGGTDPQARQAGAQPGTANRGPWSGLLSGGARLRGEDDESNGKHGRLG